MGAARSLTDTNRAVVEGLYAAAMAGDFESLMCFLSDDVVVHEPPFGSAARIGDI